MEKITKSRLILLFVLFASSFYGCRKYEDNPALGYVNYKRYFKKHSTFKLEQIRVDGADSTGRIENYKSITFYFELSNEKEFMARKMDLLVVNIGNTSCAFKQDIGISNEQFGFIWGAYHISAVYPGYGNEICPNFYNTLYYLEYSWDGVQSFEFVKLYKDDFHFKANNHGKEYLFKLKAI